MSDAAPEPEAVSLEELHPGTRVTGRDGLRGSVEAVDARGQRAVVRLASGHRLRVPADAFGRGGDASLTLDVGDADVESAAAAKAKATQDGPEPLVVPVLEERVRLGKEKVVTSRVRLHKTVETEKRELHAPLLREEVQVQHVPHGSVVQDPSHPPEPREVDGVLIVPVLEERLVVVKQLVLKEEVHVRRLRKVEEHTEEVDVRHESLHVERIPEGTPDTPATPKN